LLRYGADPNLQGSLQQTPLHEMLVQFDGDPQIVRILLQFGARPDIHDEAGNTPLEIAEYKYGTMYIQPSALKELDAYVNYIKNATKRCIQDLRLHTADQKELIRRAKIALGQEDMTEAKLVMQHPNITRAARGHIIVHAIMLHRIYRNTSINFAAFIEAYRSRSRCYEALRAGGNQVDKRYKAYIDEVNATSFLGSLYNKQQNNSLTDISLVL